MLIHIHNDCLALNCLMFCSQVVCVLIHIHNDWEVWLESYACKLFSCPLKINPSDLNQITQYHDCTHVGGGGLISRKWMLIDLSITSLM